MENTGSTDGAICPAREREEALPDGRLLARAPAKLNLALRVLGRRRDGYHEIDSIVAKVTLYDELVFRPRTDGRVGLECSGLDAGPLEDNLVLRAAGVLARERRRQGVDIHLHKSIPTGAGLGGGSSDAAAALRALDRLWGLGLSGAVLAQLAAGLGSDVPLFLDAPAVRIRGRGELVEPADVPAFHALLFLPPVRCRTADVYAAHDRMSAGPPGEPPQPPVPGEALQGPPSRWRAALFNDLRPAAARVCPVLEDLAGRLQAAAGLPVHMTGSGSGLFVLFDDRRGARQALDALPAQMRSSCRIVSMNPW